MSARRVDGRWSAAVLFLLIILQSAPAFAVVKTVETSLCRVTVYAPDWVWLGQNANLMAVVEVSPARKSIQIGAGIQAPEELNLEENASFNLKLEPGESGTYRFALSNVPIENVSVGDRLEFRLHLGVIAEGAIDPDIRSIMIPIEVRRGAVVREGIWSALLPAIVAVAWCLVFAFYLVRRSRAGAWKTPSEPLWEGDGNDV